jgi:hypothetical protein
MSESDRTLQPREMSLFLPGSCRRGEAAAVAHCRRPQQANGSELVGPEPRRQVMNGPACAALRASWANAVEREG